MSSVTPGVGQSLRGIALSRVIHKACRETCEVVTLGIGSAGSPYAICHVPYVICHAWGLIVDNSLGSGVLARIASAQSARS